jgi:hypothetical protein
VAAAAAAATDGAQEEELEKGLKRTPEEIARWRERAQFIEDVLERMGPIPPREQPSDKEAKRDRPKD